MSISLLRLAQRANPPEREAEGPGEKIEDGEEGESLAYGHFRTSAMTWRTSATTKPSQRAANGTMKQSVAAVFQGIGHLQARLWRAPRTGVSAAGDGCLC